jgi:VanZ family protein
MKKKNWLYYILPAAWMIVIFCFSAQPAAASDENNHFIIRFLLSMGIDLTKFMGAGFANFMIRKSAHMTEYAVLAVLLLISFLKNSKMRPYLISLFFCLIYAASDEFHQMFVPGRSCRAVDVLIDMTGASAITLIIFIIKYVKNNKTMRDKKDQSIDLDK